MNLVWTIQLFGELCACRGTECITRFASKKTASLLAFLAYHRDRTHSREALIELLWPECEPSQGRNRLSTLLAFLRRLLEPVGTASGSVLQANHSHVRLHPQLVSTDVTEFERLLGLASQAEEGAARIGLLQEALGLYREGLLPGFYEEWVLQAQQCLRARYVEALQELGWNLQQVGSLETALEAVGKALAVDPYREPCYRLQMRLYAALGQPAGAQQSYDRLERVFREELGVSPSAATRELAEQIRRNPRAVAQVQEVATSASRGAAFPQAQDDAAIEIADSSRQRPQGADTHLTNLPAALTRFFGREEQTEVLRKWLVHGDTRLVTLTGPGGAGKTRLAVETMRCVAPAFSGRVWFVDLASLQDGRLLPFALASTLQVTLSPQSEPFEQVVEKLQEGASLLVLDNFEHLLRMGSERSKSERVVGGESALLVRLLLEQVPDLKCLVTSRQPLHLGGEQELSIPPLAVPAAVETLQHLLEYAGVALYVDRAKAVKPEFALTEQNAEAVVALCRKLEGMPLAIEMAAAWTKTLPPAKMLERLEHQLDLLVSRRRDLPARQQSLRATFEWSYDLLEPDLQRCFARLSVFRGGFDIEAVEALCGSGVLGMLSELQERSLVLGEEVGEEVRYRLLESLREYGNEKLEASGERAGIQQRHAEYFLALAEEAEPRLTGPDQALWLKRLDREPGNLRAALEWSGGTSDDDEMGLRLCSALYQFWVVRGHISEGRAWYAMALSQTGSQGATRAWANALNGAGGLAYYQGDYMAARTYFEASLALRREMKDTRGIASSLNSLGAMAYSQDDYVAARAYLEQSLAIKQEMGDQAGSAVTLGNLGTVASSQADYDASRAYQEKCLAIKRELGDKVGIATSLNNLGSVVSSQGDYDAARAYYKESLALRQEIGDKGGIANSFHSLGGLDYSLGDYDTARAYFEESLSIKREMGDPAGIAASLNNLGNVAHYQRDYDAARRYYKQSLSLFRELGDKGGIANSLEGFADLDIVQAQVERAARLWGAAEQLREEIGMPRPPSERAEYEGFIALAREALDAAAFAAAWEAGRQMTLEQAVAEALSQLLGNPHGNVGSCE